MSKSHSTEPSKHPKQDFQVERLAFFSDAVFAIAITLLIIEFKVPHVTTSNTYAEVWGQLVELKYQLFSLLISFILISTYWIRHHFLFKHIHNYNKKIVVANLFLLLPIIFFPFTTAFLSESIDNKDVVILGLRLFLLNHVIANFSMLGLYWLAFIKHKEYSYEIPLHEKQLFMTQTIIPGIAFLVVLFMTNYTIDIEVLSYAIIAGLAVRILSEKYIIKKEPGAN